MSQQLLIIEDDSRTVFLYKNMIRPLGLDILTAEDVQQALPILQRTTPHIILLDIGLPGPNGNTLLTYIQRESRLHHCKVIVLTAYPNLLEELDRSLLHEIRIKPVKPQDLRRIIQACL